jgi:hypothetical protein
MAHCQILHKEGWTKDTNYYSWFTRPKFHPSEKADAISDCLKIQLISHVLCDEIREWRVEAGVQALLEAVDNNPLERIGSCDLQKLINSLKLRKAHGIGDIPNECLRHLPRRPLVHLTNLLNHCHWLSFFQILGRKEK